MVAKRTAAVVATGVVILGGVTAFGLSRASADSAYTHSYS